MRRIGSIAPAAARVVAKRLADRSWRWSLGGVAPAALVVALAGSTIVAAPSAALTASATRTPSLGETRASATIGHVGSEQAFRVTRTIEHRARTLVSLRTASGTLDVTPDHRLFVLQRGFVRAGDIRRGDRLRSGGEGEVLVTGSEIRSLPELPVFNLTVDEAHTYYVGQSKVLAHNAGKGCAADVATVTPAEVDEGLRTRAKLKLKPEAYNKMTWEDVPDPATHPLTDAERKEVFIRLENQRARGVAPMFDAAREGATQARAVKLFVERYAKGDRSTSVLGFTSVVPHTGFEAKLWREVEKSNDMLLHGELSKVASVVGDEPKFEDSRFMALVVRDETESIARVSQSAANDFHSRRVDHLKSIFSDSARPHIANDSDKELYAMAQHAHVLDAIDALSPLRGIQLRLPLRFHPDNLGKPEAMGHAYAELKRLDAAQASHLANDGGKAAAASQAAAEKASSVIKFTEAGPSGRAEVHYADGKRAASWTEFRASP